TTAELLQHLAHGLGLIPKDLDALEVRHAEQFVEALGQAEVGETLAQDEPTAFALGLTGCGGKQRPQVRIDDQRNIDLQPLQGRYRRLSRRPRLCWRRR